MLYGDKKKEDIDLTCLCGKDFVFTVSEQIFFDQRDFCPPKRCHGCRAEKKRKLREEEDVEFQPRK